jgi:hypothetical protein
LFKQQRVVEIVQGGCDLINHTIVLVLIEGLKVKIGYFIRTSLNDDFRMFFGHFNENILV